MRRHVAQQYASIQGLLEPASRLRACSLPFNGPLVPLELLAMTASSAYAFSTCISRSKNRGSPRLPIKPGKLQIIGPNSSRNATNQASDTFTPDTSQSTTSTVELASAPASKANQAFRRLEKHLQAPYPRELLQITNEHLRQEVFRSTRPNGHTISPELPQAYYHTALEKKGDDLTRMIADEVAIYWFLQFSQDYNSAAKFLNAHNYHPVSALIRNTHWTVLSRQFGIHSGNLDSPNGSSNDASRLADNFEAYVYALYLDQGLDAVYDFLCPIFLKKLYSQAQQLEIPLPPRKKVTVVGGDGQAETPGLFARLRSSLSSWFHSQQNGASICRIDYEGLPLPDWEVPCTNGRECRRDDCYFDHSGDPIPRKPGPQLWEAEGPPGSTPINAAQPQGHQETKEQMTGSLDSDTRSMEAPTIASPSPAEVATRLESGVMKRITGLLFARIDREQKLLTSEMESLVKKRTAELWQGRKATRKAMIMEVFQSWNEPAGGLPEKITKAVETRVDKVAERTFEKVLGSYKERVHLLQEKLASVEAAYAILEEHGKQPATLDSNKIAKLEERLAVLEGASSKSGYTTAQPQDTSPVSAIAAVRAQARATRRTAQTALYGQLKNQQDKKIADEAAAKSAEASASTPTVKWSMFT